MAKVRGRRCAASRVYGEIDLFGSSRLDKKCKNPTVPPGQHGQKRLGVKSEYATQLREKQKAKRMYGILEKQFRNYYKESANHKGATGNILLQLLERRLDNVVYRMGFGATRAEARQLVNHRSILVNGKIVNISSYRVKAGDVVEVKEKCKAQARIQAAVQLASSRKAPEWLDVDLKALSGIFKSIPDSADLPVIVDAHLIVEFYSK